MKNRSGFTRHILAGASAFAFSLSAVAQEDIGGPAAETAPAEEEAAVLGTVVVTAQRRSESLNDVPISVTVISSRDLEKFGIGSTGDLGKITPGLSMDRAGPFLQPTIRGIGSSVTGPGIGTSVATYVDGFYQPSTVSNDFALADVSSVQVLKGPQGTLFGRNSTGGAILVTTTEPGFDPAVYGRVSVADYQDVSAALTASTGITDKLAILGSAFVSYDRGYARDVVTGDPLQEARSQIYRVKFLYQPVSSTKLTFAYTHGDVSDPWGVAQVAYKGVSAAAGIPGVIVPDNPRSVAANLPPKTRIRYNSYYLTGEIDFGNVTAKSFTGYRNENGYVQLDSDKTSFAFQYIDFRPTDKTFTQEFNLSSNQGGALQWVTGVYYYRDEAAYKDLGVTQGGPRFTFLNAMLDTEAVSVFGDLTYEVADNLFLTGGLRYNHEDVEETFDSILSGYQPESFSKSFEDVSPRAVIRYQWTPDTNIYASYNQGYKAGTFNPTGLDPNPVRPEKVDAYEVGLKTSGSQRRFSIAGFYYDYKDLQFVSYVGPTASLTNAAEARIYGIDAELVQQITHSLQLSLSANYTDAKYKSFPGANRYTYLGNGVIVNGPNDASGNRMVRTPEFSGRVALDYETNFLSGTLRANAAYKYQTEIVFDPFGETRQPGYGLLDARISWTDPEDRYTFSLFGNNLTDETYYAVVTQQSESWPANYGHPRVIGAELSFGF